MTMEVILFDVLVGVLVVSQFNREKNWINIISVLMMPYALFATLNNFVFVKFGFYPITSNTLIMLGCSFVLFWFGGVAFNSNVKRTFDEKENSKILAEYDLKGMTVLLYIIAVMGVAKLAISYMAGAFSSSAINTAEGLMGSGLIGHFLLLSYSILPIVFLAWVEEKKMKYIIPILLIAVVTFSSLIKNNIIGMIMELFLFITRYKKSTVKKSILVCLGLIVAVFLGNYFITFFISKSSVTSTFYINQLFVYCSGSMINDNKIFTDGIRVNTGLFHKLMTAILGLPNMFIEKLVGHPIFPFESLPEMNVGSVYGQTSNVVDSFGYFFPSKGSMADVILYGIFVLAIGFVFSLVYYKSSLNRNGFNVFICCFMTYFVAFSFFGTFYILSAPWEILVYSLIIPRCFHKPKRRLSFRLRG